MSASRRDVLKLAGAAALLPRAAWPQARGRIVIVGGGFGGGTCARYLRRVAPDLEVTLIEERAEAVTCPFSNTVIAGMNDMAFISHGFGDLERAGVTVVQARAEGIDIDGRSVRLQDGGAVPYDRLVLSPGIGFKPDAIAGYDAAAAEIMPHAWRAGPQTLLLRRQLEEMEDGGVFVMAIPPNPFRCPPGPYERASLVAHYFKTSKPRSKILLIDAKDGFSKQGLFMEGWERLYPGMIEWLPFEKAGNLIRVEPATKTIVAEFLTQSADVANVIPPQRAADIVVATGLTGGEDWCVVDPVTFEAVEAPGIHVLGDSAIAGAMPKSGFSASSQAKVCAYAIAALQSGSAPPEPSFINTCYSLVGPDYGISVADVFRLGDDGSIKAVEGAGGVSPSGASAEFRQREADYARGWYASQMADIYG